MSGEHRDQAETLRIMVSPPSGRPFGSSDFSAGASERGSGAETLRIMDPPPSGRPFGSSDLWAGASERASGAETPWIVPHRVIVVAGGRSGVGATTIARNLAAGAAQMGMRALYVEPDAGEAPRPGGADYYLLDAGTSADLEGLADYLVLVTSSDAESVKGVYLALQRFRRSDPDLAAGVVVNRVRAPEDGVTLGERIASAARAFIRGPELDVLGWILADLEAVLTREKPLVTENPRSAAAAGVRLCVRRLWARWRARGKVLAA